MVSPDRHSVRRVECLAIAERNPNDQQFDYHISHAKTIDTVFYQRKKAEDLHYNRDFLCVDVETAGK